ncbi:MAG: hypothetical protein N3D09_02980, partial [Archaeoglobaceae archaeon]|nr:hypothetical protein [Archaeoglobaceae archaeon]
MIPGHEVVGIVLATISALRHLGFSGEIWGIEKNEKLSGKLFINGGVDMAFECVGTADAVDLALRIT